MLQNDYCFMYFLLIDVLFNYLTLIFLLPYVSFRPFAIQFEFGVDSHTGQVANKKTKHSFVGI